MNVNGILQQYAGNNPDVAAGDVMEHYQSVAQELPQNELAQGLSAAFNSDRTPAFGQMLSGLFQNSSPEQKSGLLNQLLSGAGSSGLAGMLGSALSGLGSSGRVTPEMASQVPAAAVAAAATQAHSQNPSIVDSISGFYAQHPALVQTLGATAVTIAMSQMAKRNS